MANYLDFRFDYDDEKGSHILIIITGELGKLKVQNRAILKYEKLQIR